MDYDQRMEKALSRVYAAMGEGNVELAIKHLGGQLSLENIEFINNRIEQHLNQSNSKKLVS